MKKITLILITLTFFAISCNHTRRQPSIPLTLSEIIEQQDIIAYTDSVIQGVNVRIFGQDSMFLFGRRGNIERVIYLNPTPNGGIRYREFDDEGNVIEVAFTTNRPLTNEFFDSDRQGRNEMFLYMDSIVRFYPNGNRVVGFQAYCLFEIDFPRFSFLPNYNVYDSTGVLVERRTKDWQNWSFIYETFHCNGTLKSRLTEASVGATPAILEVIEWDSLGRKTRKMEGEFSFQEGYFSSRDRFEVYTDTEFFPNGNIKQITRTKTFPESGLLCPCGEWRFYDENGRLIHAEQHPPCDNFELECEDFEMFIYRNLTIAEAYSQFLNDKPWFARHLLAEFNFSDTTFTSQPHEIVYRFFPDENRLLIKKIIRNVAETITFEQEKIGTRVRWGSLLINN